MEEFGAKTGHLQFRSVLCSVFGWKGIAVSHVHLSGLVTRLRGQHGDLSFTGIASEGRHVPFRSFTLGFPAPQPNARSSCGRHVFIGKMFLTSCEIGGTFKPFASLYRKHMCFASFVRASSQREYTAPPSELRTDLKWMDTSLDKNCCSKRSNPPRLVRVASIVCQLPAAICIMMSFSDFARYLSQLLATQDCCGTSLFSSTGSPKTFR